MNIKDKAKEFAINAHKGQIRKSDKEKPMIIHPINVADILSEYGFDDNVVAAGYLHDVIEDTKYTKEDLLKAFNEDILSLVLGDTEKDKSLSWEERKIETINIVKDLDLRHKSIVCADKISNLEDMRIIFETRGEKDFSAFKRGYEKQKWYYTEVYNSLICNEDKNYPMFARLKLLIDDVFDNNKHDDLERKIFEGKEEEYDNYINEYVPIIKNKIDIVIGTYTDSLTSLRRDYTANVALEKRSFLSEDNVNEYNNSLLNMKMLTEKENINFYMFDTTNKSEREISFEVVDTILNNMRTYYINKLNEEFNK